MKTTLITALIFTFISSLTIAQTQEELNKYSELTKKALAYYKNKKYPESAQEYEKAFETLDGKAYSTDRYNAACSYALSKNKKKAFFHLFRLTEGGAKYKNLNHITKDSDLDFLHNKRKWSKLISQVEANKAESEKDLDRELVNKLDSIHYLDQTYRNQINEIVKEFGRDSEELKAHWKLINYHDSLNLIEIKKIIDTKGWLGPNIIGNRGNSTLFLVIQHSDLETQKKYLPMMKDAVKKGNANASSLALLEDRIALRSGEKQIYGSQIGQFNDTGVFFVSPLIEPEKVNERRAKVGLGLIEDYVKYWDFTWDLETHKKNMLRYEKLQAKP